MKEQEAYMLRNRIKKLYKSYGLKQEDMADKIGIKTSKLRKIINQNDGDMKIDELKKICASLDISLFDLFNSSEFYGSSLQDIPYRQDYSDYFHDSELAKKYETYGYDHAGDILANCYRKIYTDIKTVLKNLQISMDDIISDGGNESNIPKKIRKEFVDLHWNTEEQIECSLQIDLKKKTSQGEKIHESSHIEGFLTGYHVDYIKNRVAVDTEWNSKDQTFDRDLGAMRAYYEAGVIAFGVIITRGNDLCTFPPRYDLSKYGASTTWMGKLLDRLDARRAGGCPIFAIGIKPNAIIGYDFTEI
jgi:CRISPR-associated protein Csd2